ncbi:bifunctional sugar phosphate isomerase/epimerase/4-hydroxyphenylpyruvate dioxygenase family protein [Chelativorans salis]|uniref:3-dehydroshikimate dehydratase n=1 Tax=Chelativorans salis TaxID=2978478 RepID=A0ABT2LHZ3_9HYPH|nr:bifunctional sugar phosphate isomerase/epimerase/4-hydroxyphenylpyruvate dioxygenase family protein [Chelativorans sp. EGI FJ00035]MCT7374196.1 bifunctional sugar phosphate isomerase/epimerase/4-hydroxyphenylpyruvate dioxygenase family protein [Chelativorans sp. EGI FJ00035]
MKTSIATVSISGDLREKLAAIAAAGFDGVEIFENDFLAFDGGPRDVGRMVRDHGLEITLFQPFRDFEGMPEPQRSRAFDRAERKFDVMQELGTDLMLVCSNVSPVSLGGIDRTADDFNELGECAAKRGLRVGYEALAWGRHVSDHRDAWEIVRRTDRPNIGLILDSFHTLARKIDVNSIRAIPGDRIFIVQLADAPLIEMDLLYWSRHFRNMPGEGDLPVVDFMRAVAATGYDGPLSLEIFNDQFRGGSPKSISVDGRRSLLYLMDKVRRLEPDIAIDVPSMPDRIEASGIEFVEFAADEAEAQELAGMFRTLGFAPAGRHISKDVTVWRQGGINLVINTEREGFAHSSYLVHGTSVCDIGLKVENASATVERARALVAEPFQQTVGRGELKIPAIRSVGGGVMHFIDEKTELARVWDIEFTPLAGDEYPAAAGLRRIDHIAQTMNYEEMLTWVLFYTSIFATDRTPMVDVVDPGGLIRSQAIESADGDLRITLNGAESRRTLAGHFIAESFGSAVQHVAFLTEDIFATAKALKENGFRSLKISRNYYDDLEARFGLEAGFAGRLREENILYDREGEGEYFQLYSPNYGEGFFFEIVERRGGYTGYGAANAQFRIAAQKRALRPKGMPRQ